jgi:hypothetical protein
MVVLARHSQTQSLNRTGVSSIFNVYELVVFCPEWQTLDCFEVYLSVAWQCPEIMGEQRGAKK